MDVITACYAKLNILHKRSSKHAKFHNLFIKFVLSNQHDKHNKKQSEQVLARVRNSVL